jgi:hypothetical protein
VVNLELEIREIVINYQVGTIPEDTLTFIKEFTGLEKKTIDIINLSHESMDVYMINQNYIVNPDLILTGTDLAFLTKFARIEPRSVNIFTIFTGYILLVQQTDQLPPHRVYPSLRTVLLSKNPLDPRWGEYYQKKPGDPFKRLIDMILDLEVKGPRWVENRMWFNTSTIEEKILIDISRWRAPDGTFRVFPDKLREKNASLLSALKMDYLMKQMIRLGGLENENLGSILDLHQDVVIPKHDDLDLEAAGVPNKLFTNVT